MNNFDHLPDEIVILILHHVDPSHLYPISIVDHRFYRLSHDQSLHPVFRRKRKWIRRLFSPFLGYQSYVLPKNEPFLVEIIYGDDGPVHLVTNTTKEGVHFLFPYDDKMIGHTLLTLMTSVPFSLKTLPRQILEGAFSFNIISLDEAKQQYHCQRPDLSLTLDEIDELVSLGIVVLHHSSIPRSCLSL